MGSHARTAGPGVRQRLRLTSQWPQYFGYLADNPEVLNTNVHGPRTSSTPSKAGKLPSDGGVFYLRGGYDNNDGLVPVDPTPGSSARSSATTIIRPIRISRSPKLSRRRRSATSPTARIGRRAPSLSPMMRRTAIRPRPAGQAQHVRRRLDPGGGPAHPDDRHLALRHVRRDLASIYYRQTVFPARLTWKRGKPCWQQLTLARSRDRGER